ncbi:Holliday junction DNA helicase RuvA [Truepera radiovictrix DSM 17093]|uniref:Holliday junction branch migration complex subunit RuvA n=1 Tax=Truepera radiovictrix (strain DSM 17093 / CIP 108686 / LMG 22925 / RQ-24) TaxID=649638 RepID=D7CTR2_TRURR|nr:Holliday junction DNA helicase RuvA [Truepera radiovictrix DSM 17093]
MAESLEGYTNKVIAYLDGVVAEIRAGSLIVQAGAFGLEVFAPKPTLMVCRVGSAVRLHTYFLVKEELLALYGFHDRDLHTLFTHLIGVSGVGPKLALALLSSMQTPLLAGAILQGDAGLLASTPGVGKKMAERIILDLKNKLPEELLAPGARGKVTTLSSPAAEDAVGALLALGYRETQVKGVVAQLALKEPEAGAETLIRKALAQLR